MVVVVADVTELWLDISDVLQIPLEVAKIFCNTQINFSHFSLLKRTFLLSHSVTGNEQRAKIFVSNQEEIPGRNIQLCSAKI